MGDGGGGGGHLAAAESVVYEAHAPAAASLRVAVAALLERSAPSLGGAAGSPPALHALAEVDAEREPAGAGKSGAQLGARLMGALAVDSARLDDVLRRLEGELARLADAAGCPLCFAPGNGAAGGATFPHAIMTPCSHRICVTCWEAWSKLHPRPFCPLCRDLEFRVIVEHLVGPARRIAAAATIGAAADTRLEETRASLELGALCSGVGGGSECTGGGSRSGCSLPA